jgi:hypothetical protein
MWNRTAIHVEPGDVVAVLAARAPEAPRSSEIGIALGLARHTCQHAGHFRVRTCAWCWESPRHYAATMLAIHDAERMGLVERVGCSKERTRKHRYRLRLRDAGVEA